MRPHPAAFRAYGPVCGERERPRPARTARGRVGRKARGGPRRPQEGAGRSFPGGSDASLPRTPRGRAPAPELSAEPAVLSPTPGAALRCRAPAPARALRPGAQGRRSWVQRVLSPVGPEAQFELRGASRRWTRGTGAASTWTRRRPSGSARRRPWSCALTVSCGRVARAPLLPRRPVPGSDGAPGA